MPTRFQYCSRSALFCTFLAVCVSACGTTRNSDTARTATEQLLVSNSIDEAVSRLNLQPLAGKKVYFNESYLGGDKDRSYLVSTLRQHLLAVGALLQEDKSKADYVVEARSGAVGTDRNEVLLGVPQFNLPAFVPGYPSGLIPEIPFVKKTSQQGITKLAVFAYNRETGRPICQTGVMQALSTQKDFWILGAGPFQRGTIHDGTQFAGSHIQIPLIGKNDGNDSENSPIIPVTKAATWAEPEPPTVEEGKVVPAGGEKEEK